MSTPLGVRHVGKTPTKCAPGRRNRAAPITTERKRGDAAVGRRLTDALDGPRLIGRTSAIQAVASRRQAAHKEKQLPCARQGEQRSDSEADSPPLCGLRRARSHAMALPYHPRPGGATHGQSAHLLSHHATVKNSELLQASNHSFARQGAGLCRSVNGRLAPSCENWLAPMQTTWPVSSRAQTCWSPTWTSVAGAVVFISVGGHGCGCAGDGHANGSKHCRPPQQRSCPVAERAQITSPPAAICTTSFGTSATRLGESSG